MFGLTAVSIVIAGLLNGELSLGDVGTVAIVGGVIGEVAARLGAIVGRESEIDGWREGMFFGAMAGLLYWTFGELGA